MKTKPRFLTLMAATIALNFAGAAENETRRVERHIVLSDAVPAVPGREASEPVTYLGVAVAPAEPALTAQLRLPPGQGLVVVFIEPDSPAAGAGLKQHDVLTKLEDQILIDPRQLSVLVRNRRAGDKVVVTHLRAGAEARATVTLATHVPAPEHAFRWSGQGGSNVLFHSGTFATPTVLHPFAVTSEAVTTPGPGSRAVAGTRIAGAPLDRVMIFRPQAGMVVSDEAGELVIHVGPSGRVLTARDVEGKVLFDGPINTPEQRAALPEDLRKRLEKMEGLDDFEAPLPPSHSDVAPGFVPAIPAQRGAGVL